MYLGFESLGRLGLGLGLDYFEGVSAVDETLVGFSSSLLSSSVSIEPFNFLSNRSSLNA